MKTAQEYLTEKYKTSDNGVYFSNPDMPLKTTIDGICGYMQEYAEYVANEEQPPTEQHCAIQNVVGSYCMYCEKKLKPNEAIVTCKECTK